MPQRRSRTSSALSAEALASLQAALAEVKGGVKNIINAPALSLLAPLQGEYLPWTAAAMRPAAVVTILNDIVVGRRRRIVECGAGVTTVWIGRLLKRRGGHLFSIEQDPGWAGVVRELLAAEQLGDCVTVLDAALKPCVGGFDWYDREPLESLLAGPAIGLLVVDGPVSAPGVEARYPALPIFSGALAEDATVVLDDINRAEERRTIARWEAEFGLSFELRRGARIGLAHRGPYVI
jgi:methyltransferase family protein